ncbi:MAG: bifunctional riboflavin kinase/FAD synthetase [Pseudomonadota bacterium]
MRAWGFNEQVAGVEGHVLALGNFDGVHRGHRALIDAAHLAARQIADSCGRAPGAGVMLFDPHPRRYFAPERPHFTLTTLQQRLRLLAGYGLDLAVVVPFDQALATMSAQAFIDDLLFTRLGVKHVVVGYDFRFGRGREGDGALLRAHAEAAGLGVTIVEPVAAQGEVYSSSTIRAQLAQGDVHGAADALGHWWRVGGKVVGGAKLGTGLGFPTANIHMAAGTALGHGIFAVRIYHGDAIYEGAAYLGTRPTFDDGKPVLEVFLFDFDGDLYGQWIDVEFIAHLRPDQRFVDGDALVAQMQRDCEDARAALARTPLEGPLRWPPAPAIAPRALSVPPATG